MTKQKKILIIEDEKNIGSVYQDFLGSFGFEVKWVTTIEAAVALSKDFSADLLLIDHGLKESYKNGIESLPDLRRLFPQAILVILSNYSVTDLDYKEGYQDNLKLVQGFWQKVELNLEQLLAKVQELLR